MAANRHGRNNGRAVGVLFSVRSVPRLYNEDQLPLQGCLETVIRRVGAWCEMAASLRGREPESWGTSTGENTADWEGL
jgi:hypothetical protein